MSTRTTRIGLLAFLATLLLTSQPLASERPSAPSFHFIQFLDESEEVPWIKRRPRRGTTIPGGGGIFIQPWLTPGRDRGWEGMIESGPLIIEEDLPLKHRAGVRRPVKDQRRTTRNRPARAAKPAPPIRTAIARPATQPNSSFVAGDVIFRIEKATAPDMQSVMNRHRLSLLEMSDLNLLGGVLVRAKIPAGQNVKSILRSLRKDRRILTPQPNYLFKQEASPPTSAGLVVMETLPQDLAAVQYAPAKMNVKEAQALAGSNRIIVAVIDSGIDGSHPELEGSIIDGSTNGTAHGTGIAGAIVSHARLMGVAPHVQILAVESFAAGPSETARGSTFEIVKGLDRAAKAGARVINLSFAGPEDSLLDATLKAALDRGIVLIASVGNAGPQADPLFPATSSAVIAVTATDAKDKLYSRAIRGDHIAVSAPGVDILVPAPGNNYQQLSGTSLAAAHVSGVAALILQRQPNLKPSEVKALLIDTSQDLGAPGRDSFFGAGLVDAFRAVSATMPGYGESMAGAPPKLPAPK